jgi:hypothetical protein
MVGGRWWHGRRPGRCVGRAAAGTVRRAGGGGTGTVTGPGRGRRPAGGGGAAMRRGVGRSGEQARRRRESAGKRAHARAAVMAVRCGDDGGGAENLCSLSASGLLLARGLSDFGDAGERKGKQL